MSSPNQNELLWITSKCWDNQFGSEMCSLYQLIEEFNPLKVYWEVELKPWKNLLRLLLEHCWCHSPEFSNCTGNVLGVEIHLLDVQLCWKSIVSNICVKIAVGLQRDCSWTLLIPLAWHFTLQRQCAWYWNACAWCSTMLKKHNSKYLCQDCSWTAKMCWDCS